MKKEKKRELTLENLEKRLKVIEKIFDITIILEIFIGIFTIITIFLEYSYLFQICMIFLFLCVPILFICVVLGNNARNQIEQKKKQIQANTMKKIAKDGNIKHFVSIKDPKIQNAILSLGIEKIEIEYKYINDICICNIQLKNKFNISIEIPKENIFSLLPEDVRRKLVEELTDSIEIEDLKDGDMRLKIKMITYRGYLYDNAQVTDDDLTEMFELKE